MGQTLASAKTTTQISDLQDEKDESMREFLLYLAPTTSANKLLEAIHALYYLPQNFKLVVAGDVDVRNNKDISWAMQNIMSRIRFSTQTETSTQQQDSPFFDADAILTDDAHDPAYARLRTPLVIVKDGMEYDLAFNERHGFDVPAGNPEAFASAMLRLARDRA
jgi:hypothetical protein